MDEPVDSFGLNNYCLIDEAVVVERQPRSADPDSPITIVPDSAAEIYLQRYLFEGLFGVIFFKHDCESVTRRWVAYFTLHISLRIVVVYTHFLVAIATVTVTFVSHS